MRYLEEAEARLDNGLSVKEREVLRGESRSLENQVKRDAHIQTNVSFENRLLGESQL